MKAIPYWIASRLVCLYQLGVEDGATEGAWVGNWVGGSAAGASSSGIWWSSSSSLGILGSAMADRIASYIAVS